MPKNKIERIIESSRKNKGISTNIEKESNIIDKEKNRFYKTHISSKIL